MEMTPTETMFAAEAAAALEVVESAHDKILKMRQSDWDKKTEQDRFVSHLLNAEDLVKEIC